jgi:Kef-type K+ transport system membrane component KefB
VEDIFTELSIIIAIGAAIALFMRIIKQPLIIGHIITGIVVGPTLLNLVHNDSTMEIFASIGIALLLFLVGLGLNPRVIKEVGKVAFLTGIGQVVFTSAIGFAILKAIGMDSSQAVYLALGLSFSSTIIVLKILNDKKEQNRLHGKIAVGFLLVQDIIATISLLFVTASSTGGLQVMDLLLLASKGAILGGSLWTVSLVLLPRLTRFVAGSQEFLFLFSIAWGLGIGAIFKQFGFSLEIGALAAGVALASSTYAPEVASRLKPLRDFFIILFFVALGSRLELSNVVSVLPRALGLSLYVLIGNPLIVIVIMGMLGYTKRTSFKAGIVVAQISEFSLVMLLLAHRLGSISQDTLSLATMVGLITIAASTYMMMYDEVIYKWVEKYLSLFERRKLHHEHATHQKNELILFGYHKGGHEFQKIFKSITKNYVVIDYDPEVIDKLEQEKVNFLYGDATDVELLEEAGTNQARLVVSTISDHPTNVLLVQILQKMNPHAVIICHASTLADAAHLYELGASYVMMPHYIGSEKITSFIKKNNLKRSQFKKYRDKHLQYLQTHYG